jgi:regulator of protease activity HflC (stomatin/prohibitin superfamily)
MKYCNWLLVVMMVIVVFGMSGCRKPYLAEKFEEVKNNETAFVVQLEGNKQAKIDSMQSLQAMQVSTKRINIPHRWKQTGRMNWLGEWIPIVTIIKVDRSPVTREWCSDTNAGTSNRDQGMWAESQDSIGFTTGFNCTAMIKEEDAAKFLYLYPGGSLTSVMDAQIRNEIQAVVSEVAAIYPMDKCREKKNEIIQVVREKVIPKFASSGITITTIGMFGGFGYEDKEIQSSINATFIAQQEKVTAKAQFEAQTDRNNTIEKAALGLKQAAITKSEGEAEAIKIKAEAEASAILAVAAATKEANSNPLFLELKKLEVETARISKWGGNYPQWITGDSGGKIGVFVNAPENK